MRDRREEKAEARPFTCRRYSSTDTLSRAPPPLAHGHRHHLSRAPPPRSSGEVRPTIAMTSAQLMLGSDRQAGRRQTAITSPRLSDSRRIWSRIRRWSGLRGLSRNCSGGCAVVVFTSRPNSRLHPQWPRLHLEPLVHFQPLHRRASRRRPASDAGKTPGEMQNGPPTSATADERAERPPRSRDRGRSHDRACIVARETGERASSQTHPLRLSKRGAMWSM